MLAPEGLALFYCRRELLQTLPPLEYGWHMLAEPGNFDNHDWQVAVDARRFECGSPNMLGTCALEASLSLLEEIGMDRVGEAIVYRSQAIIEGLQARSGRYGLITRTQPDRLAGIVTFRPLQEPVDDLFQRLRAAGVLCAQRAGGIRVSPHAYTPMSVIERFLDLL